MGPDIGVLLHEADLVAGRLGRRFRLSSYDREDVRQILLVDVLARLRFFDPARGLLGAFAGTVMRHRVGRIAQALVRERTLFTTAPAEVSGADPGEPTCPHEGVRHHPHDLRIDLANAIQLLNQADRALCQELIWSTPSEICRAGRRSRAGVYRAIGKIRAHLMSNGITGAA